MFKDVINVNIPQLQYSIYNNTENLDEIGIELSKSILSHSAILWNDLCKYDKNQRGAWFIVYKSIKDLHKYNLGEGGCEIYFRHAEELLESPHMSDNMKFIGQYDNKKYFAIIELVLPEIGFMSKCKCALVPFDENELFPTNNKEKFTHLFSSKARIICINRCNFCKKMGNQKKCQRCKSCYYCSRECQKNDWKTHKKKCVPLKETQENVSVTGIIQ